MLNPSEFKAGRRNLIAVLDWGLGHASRSLALAQRLRAGGEEVIWTSAGPALEMIRRETAGETSFELPAYAIRYRSRNMYWNMARQLPKLRRVIQAEKRLIPSIIHQSGADRLISDNRFGCYSAAVPSIFMSHQLHPIVPWPVAWMYRQYLRPYAAYWVPDEAAEQRLSGHLSAARGYHNVHYLGHLSRLSVSGRTAHDFSIGALLSGPEPQRSKLEEQLLKLLPQIPGQHFLIRGLANSREKRQQGPVFIQDYADAAELAALLPAAQLVLARSGYSSLMDMQALEIKQALLIPTPGQTEQIYLAQRAKDQGWARTVAQTRLQLANLEAALS